MKLALPIVFFTMSHIAISQSMEVQKWQEENPHVLFIEATDFSNIGEEKKALLGNDIIIYSQNISIQDINSYTASKAEAKTASKSLVDSNSPSANEIKNWLAKNSNLKIIHNSYYSSLTHGEQQVYLESNALIYYGEHLTIDDIKQYNESH